MKKCIALCMLMVLLAGLLPTGASAAEAPQICVGTAAANAGEQISVDVSLKNNPGINTFTLSIEYDKTKLALANVTQADAFKGTFMFSDKTEAVIWQLTQDTTYEGTAFTLTFDVLDSAAGEAAVTVSYLPGNVCNFDEKDVDFEIVSGSVTIAGENVPESGDANGDGKINSRDVLAILQFRAGKENVTINETAADVNQDGKINSRDILAILQLRAGK